MHGSYPDDWEIYEFDDIFRIISNNTLSRDKLTIRGNIGNIHYGDVLIKYGTIITANDDIPKIKPEYESSAKIFLRKNDIIIADTAEDETVGKAVQIGNIDIPLVAGLHTIPCRPIIPTAPGYLGYYINSKAYHDQLLPYITGIKVSSISKASIKKTLIPLPTLKEQTAIADTLAVFDTHIANLTELIAKKKAIREGALDELMTGRTRLKGFCGDWEVKALGKIASIQDGTHGTFVRVQLGKLLLSAKNVFDNNLVITDDESRVSQSDYNKIISNGYPRIGDILMSCVGTIGRCCLLDRDGVAFQRSVAFIRPHTLYNKYLMFLLQSRQVQRQLAFLTNASAQGGIYLNSLKQITILFTPDKDEQTAIVDTLSALDKEISSLETERAKISQIRDGVMNDLLTGKVRLDYGI